MIIKSVIWVFIISISVLGLACTLVGEVASTQIRRQPTAVPNTPMPSPIPTPSMAEKDRETLIAVFNAVGGGLFNDHNWLSDKPLKEWRGITVDDNGRVTGFNTTRLAVPREIPDEVGNLDALEYLDLSYSNFFGNIPPELGNLGNLKYLALQGNDLSGNIPPELGKLTSLTHLNMEYNDKLVGEIPSELGDLPNLDVLYLDAAVSKLSGCIPVNLKDIPSNDLDTIGLPFCTDPVHLINTSVVPPSPSESDEISELSEKEYELIRHIHSQINNKRVTNGLETLLWDTVIFSIAQSHSRDMAANDYVSHVNLEGQEPADREKAAGLSCYRETNTHIIHSMGENLFRRERADLTQSAGDLARLFVEGWMGSQSHREALLFPAYMKTGIGVVIEGNDIYVTQNFC